MLSEEALRLDAQKTGLHTDLERIGQNKSSDQRRLGLGFGFRLGVLVGSVETLNVSDHLCLSLLFRLLKTWFVVYLCVFGLVVS